MISLVLTLVASLSYFAIIYWDRIQRLYRGILRLLGHEGTSTPRQRHAARDGPWEKSMKGVVLGLSDTQLVTGLSISITAYRMYAKGTIDLYHFAIATDLSWSSIGVHALCLWLPQTIGQWPVAPSTQTSGSQQLTSPPKHKGQWVRVGVLVWR